MHDYEETRETNIDLHNMDIGRVPSQGNGQLNSATPQIDLQDYSGANAEGDLGEEPRKNPLLLFSVLVMGGLFGVIHLTGTHDDPLENFMEFGREIFSFDKAAEKLQEREPSLAPEKILSEKETIVKGTHDNENVTVFPKSANETKPIEIENPYWALPIVLGNHPEPMSPAWSSSLEESWRYGLGHEFMYQRYKTIEIIRRSRLQGSEVLLFEALEQPKFWLRMEALLGLAEFGFEVDISTVERALGNARESLRRYYFQRFHDLRTPGAIFIAKQVLRISPAPARLVLLQVLTKQRNPENDLYLAAAKYDPSQIVQRWWQEVTNQNPVSPAVQEKYVALIAASQFSQQGQESEEQILGGDSGIEGVTVDTVDGSAAQEVEFLDEGGSEITIDADGNQSY